MNDVNALIDEAVLAGDGKPDAKRFSDSRIARLTPLIEAVGKWRTTDGTIKSKEFSFEREWRLIGPFLYSRAELHGVIVKAGDSDAFRADLIKRGVVPPYVAALRFVELA